MVDPDEDLSNSEPRLSRFSEARERVTLTAVEQPDGSLCVADTAANRAKLVRAGTTISAPPVEIVPIDVRITDVLRAAAECAAVWPRSSACGVLGQSLEQLGLVVPYIDPLRTRGSGYRVPDDLEARLEALRQPPRYVVGVDLANSSDDVPTTMIIEVPVRCRDCGLQGVEHCSACKGMRESAAEIASMAGVKPARPARAVTQPIGETPAPPGPDALGLGGHLDRSSDIEPSTSWGPGPVEQITRAEMTQIIELTEREAERRPILVSPKELAYLRAHSLQDPVVGDQLPSMKTLHSRLAVALDAEHVIHLGAPWLDAQDRDARMALGFGTIDRLVEAAERHEIAWCNVRGWFRWSCQTCNDTGQIADFDGPYDCGACKPEGKP